MVAWGLGDHDTAIGNLQEARDLARTGDSQRWTAISLSNLAFVCGDHGDLAADSSRRCRPKLRHLRRHRTDPTAGHQPSHQRYAHRIVADMGKDPEALAV